MENITRRFSVDPWELQFCGSQSDAWMSLNTPASGLGFSFQSCFMQEWFWWFKPAVRERVHEKQAISAKQRKAFMALDKEAYKKFSDAKAELGLWSEEGTFASLK